MTVLSTLSSLCGVIYFTAWSVSFIPQCVLNYQRKSVVGLSFSFQLLNIIGYFAYSVYTCVLKFAPRVTREYLALNGPPVPVDLSDVVFALWGLAITTFTIAQCFYYPSGDQLPAKWAVAVATALVLLADFAFVLCGLRVNDWTWLDAIYVFSYIKLIVTALKYIPQAYLNYKRQSTVGWSIVNILLDLTGGFFSFVQQSLDAIDSGNSAVFFKNPVKFGLSWLSIGFDIFFIIQHYCLYTDRSDPEKRERLREEVETEDLIL